VIAGLSPEKQARLARLYDDEIAPAYATRFATLLLRRVRPTAAARFVYAIGGDGGSAAAPLDTVEAEDLPARAEVLPPGQTGGTGPAGDERVHHHTLPGLPALDRRIDLDDGGDRLVAQDETRLPAFAVTQESMDVGTADGGHLDLEERVAGSNRGLGHVLDLDVPRTGIDEGSHGPESITGPLGPARMRSRIRAAPAQNELNTPPESMGARPGLWRTVTSFVAVQVPPRPSSPPNVIR